MRNGAKRNTASAMGIYGLLVLTVALLSLSMLLQKPTEAALPPTTMNFQGRLADSSGNLMPDGLYNMQFRLFSVSSGGSAVWTETRETTNRVQVTNGLFSTQLGEANPLSASLFDATNLYFEITMATPGTATCSTASCATWESPMTPRQKLATSAYAFNSSLLNGKSDTDFAAASGSANYIQNTGTPQTADFNITGTGTANLLQASTFDRATSGTLTIGGTNATSINLADDVVVAGTNTLRITGDTSTNIQAIGSPTEGMITYDTTNKQLLTYTNGKWQADRSDAILVAASNSSQADKNAADYVADGNTGAANDGDQVQINNALTAGSGKKVVLLAGTYTTDNSILVPNNTSLSGVGDGTLITQGTAVGFGNGVIENTDKTTGTGVTIKNLKIDGASLAGNGMFLEYMGNASAGTERKGAVVSEVTVVNFTGDNGIQLSSTDATTITNSTFINNLRSINLYLADNNIINNNTMLDSDDYGVRLWTATNNTISGNTMIGALSAGVYLRTSSSKNTITGNTFDNVSIGVNIDNGDYNVVTGNSVNNNDSNGFLVFSDNNIITSNTVTNSSSASFNDGIAIYGNSNVISSNIVTDTACTTNCYAIDISGSGNYISDNRISGPSAQYPATINDAGTGTIYGNQTTTANQILQSSSSLIKANASGTISGNGATTDGTATLTGTTTYFLSQLQVGDRITVNAQTKTITAIASNTSLTVDSSFTGTGSGYTITRLPAALVIQDAAGANTLQVSDSGAATFRNSTNSTTALQVQNASGNGVLTVDTSNNRVGIGTDAPTRTLEAVSNNSNVNSPNTLIVQNGTGDNTVELQSAGGSYLMGIDASDDSKFKISSSRASGSSTTFGKITQGSNSYGTGNSSTILGAKYTTGVSGGTVTSISVNWRTVTAGSEASYAIYTDNSGDPDSLVTNSEAQEIPSTGWVTFDVTPVALSASTTYWIAVNTDNDSNTMWTDWTSNNGDSFNDSPQDFSSGWPATLSVTASEDSAFSFYATYTTSGAYDSFNKSLFELGGSGQALFQNSEDSTTAFQIQNASGSELFTADTANRRVYIGDTTADANADLLVLDTKNTSGDPTGLNGAMYYDTNTNKFRCYENGEWKDCISGADSERITLVPEFQGAVIQGDGSNNSGTMYSGFVDGLGASDGYKHNYYEWYTSQSTAQDYDIVLNHQLPSDFNATNEFDAGSWKVWTYSDNLTNGSATMTVYDEDGTACASAVSIEGPSTGWEQVTLSDFDGVASCDFTANSIITIKVTLGSTSPSTNKVRLGEIQYDYSR